MAYRGFTGRIRLRVSVARLFWLIAFCPSVILPTQPAAGTQLPGYVQADDAFMHLTLDERVKLQVLLTAAGYWPACPMPTSARVCSTRSCSSRSTTALRR